MKANPLRLKLPLLIFFLAVAAALALFIGSCATTLFDNDRYGKVAVPGDGRLELDEGKALISYERRANLPSDSSIDAPEDLRITVRSLKTREPIRIERAGSVHSYNYNDLYGTSVARAFVPEDGDYEVLVRRAPGAGGAEDEAITFGPDLSVGKLLLRSVLIVGGGLLLALLVAGIGAAIGRARGEGPIRTPPTPPVPAAAAAAAPSTAPTAATRATATAAPPPTAAASEPAAAEPTEDAAAALAVLEDERKRENMSDEEYAARRRKIIEGI